MQYIIEPEVAIAPSMKEDMKTQPPVIESQYKPIRVRFNDGLTYSEIDIPIISQGQRIIVEHQNQKTKEDQKGPDVIVRPPYAQDDSHKLLVQAYLEKGLEENQDSQAISLSDAQEKIRDFYHKGSYDLALQVVNKALDRYPSHPIFLRAKGSIIYMMGEKDEAARWYEKAQEIEYDETVEWQLTALRGE